MYFLLYIALLLGQAFTLYETTQVQETLHYIFALAFKHAAALELCNSLAYWLVVKFESKVYQMCVLPSKSFSLLNVNSSNTYYMKDVWLKKYMFGDVLNIFYKCHCEKMNKI